MRALLERHGIPKHRHSSFVGELFGLSRAAAHQRVNKSTAWTVDEFQQLADRFGETLAEVLGATTPHSGTDAVLRVGALQIGCRVWFASETDDTSSDALVAMENAGSYVVMPATAAVGQESLRIARLEVGHAKAVAPRVAVFDDERDVANALCAHLRTMGIEAMAYYTAEDLLADIPQGLFDGYVIDWLLPNKETTVSLLAAVRHQPKRSALVLLTGNTRNGSADPAEVAAAASNFKAQLVEKPVQPPFLLSALVTDGLDVTGRAVAPLA
ncbi:helix-turn-helix domain-containing protein [Variovorax sp. WS11]|uniref:helix-turn-helix domain-containing protein n=1 Tax=Variovorax sp. WS11 TaxID=1105204 RepID=UPI0013D97CC3|nr:helix-turn-helix domain-containing protein [Variovorax sp. WS11]NDZ17135.1 hypothetical protein [Variovorax sp. WS11]